MTLNDAEHWNTFYGRFRLSVPSQFCAMVAVGVHEGDQVVEFGCGNGRDAICFARYGARVLALDASEAAIGKARSDNSSIPEEHLHFMCADAGNSENIRSIINNWRKIDRKSIFYARFFLHAIDEHRQNNLLRAIHELMTCRDQLFIEFRTVHDAAAHKEFGQHYRRYIDHDDFRDLLISYGFRVDYSVQGYGMAVFKGEDAHVARFVASRT